MPSSEEPRKNSTISSQIFDLLKVGITLALTGLIGGGITYYYQERAHRAQQEQAELATARQSALTFLREVGDILEQRRHFALRVLDTIQENAPPEERDQAWKDYNERRQRLEREVELVPGSGSRTVRPGNAKAFLR